MGILKLLYTETEAAVGSKFPLKPRPLAEIVEMTGMGEQELAPILENMAGKGLVVDIPRKGTTYYMLSPMVIGFFEYTLMRAGGPTCGNWRLHGGLPQRGAAPGAPPGTAYLTAEQDRAAYRDRHEARPLLTSGPASSGSRSFMSYKSARKPLLLQADPGATFAALFSR